MTTQTTIPTSSPPPNLHQEQLVCNATYVPTATLLILKKTAKKAASPTKRKANGDDNASRNAQQRLGIYNSFHTHTHTHCYYMNIHYYDTTTTTNNKTKQDSRTHSLTHYYYMNIHYYDDTTTTTITTTKDKTRQ